MARALENNEATIVMQALRDNNKLMDVLKDNFYPSSLQDTYSFIELWAAYYEGDFASLSNKTNKLLKNKWLYKNTEITYPYAKRTSSKIAKKVITEMPRITIENDQSMFDEWKKDTDLFAKLRLGVEMAAALGGVYFRLITRENMEKPMLTVIKPQDCIPLSYKDNKVHETASWSLVREPEQKGKGKNDYFWLLTSEIERDGKWYQTNQLFKGTIEAPGQEVALNYIKETKDTPMVIDLETESKWTHYYKSPETNNIQPYSKLGMSIFANVLEMIDMLNLIKRSWYKEHKLKKPKVAVSEDILMTTYDMDGKPQGTQYDEDEEVYVKLDIDPKDSSIGNLIEAIEWDYKTDEMSASFKDHLSDTNEAVGLGVANIKKVGSGAQNPETATGLEIAEKDTFETKADFQEALDYSLRQIILTLYKIEGKELDQEKLTIEYMDSIKHNQKENMEKVAMAKEAGLPITDETYLSMLFPDWSEEKIKKEIEAARAEKATIETIDFMGKKQEAN